jgi:hypothetical protein
MDMTVSQCNHRILPLTTIKLGIIVSIKPSFVRQNFVSFDLIRTMCVPSSPVITVFPFRA